MKDLSDILNITAIFDIRVETLAAALLARSNGGQQEFDIEQAVISPVGHARRRSSREVKAVKRKYYEQDTALFIEVNRKGLFDTLPERLLLRLDEPYKNATERTRAIEQQIREARKFFLPFEQAMYHPRIEAEQLEQHWTEHFPDFVETIWGLPLFEDCLDSRQRFLLCYLLPEAYRVVGNWELTGLCFEAVLQKPVNLNFVPPKQLKIPNNDTPANELQLGRDTILGDAFKDDMPAIEVGVKGVTVNDLPDYLPGGGKRKVLEELLYSYFLPLDVSVITRILVTDDSWGFTLGEFFLGYNMRI